MKPRAIESLRQLFKETKQEVYIHKHPSPRGFPSCTLELFGRPKKLAKWGFRIDNNKPGKVVKIR